MRKRRRLRITLYVVGSASSQGERRSFGVEPIVRYAVDLGYAPVVISDACGAVNEEAGRRAMAVLEHAGDAMVTDMATICSLLRERRKAAS